MREIISTADDEAAPGEVPAPAWAAPATSSANTDQPAPEGSAAKPQDSALPDSYRGRILQVEHG